MTVPPPYSNRGESRAAGSLSGIRFENISIAAPSVLGEPQILWGTPSGRIQNLVFQNLTIGGKEVQNADFFQTNDFVESLTFSSDQ